MVVKNVKKLEPHFEEVFRGTSSSYRPIEYLRKLRNIEHDNSPMSRLWNVSEPGCAQLPAVSALHG